MSDLKIAIIVVIVILIAGYGLFLLTSVPKGAVEAEIKACEIDSDCAVFGKDGDCNCGCFNKDYKWEKQGDCFCAAPKTCECVDRKCEQVFEQETQLPNPAAVYCEEQGGTLENRMVQAGQKGFCIFEDNSECGQWAFFRQECEKGQRFCKDLCGDGTCGEIVCMALGCPCAETLENCAEDCGDKLDLLQGKWRASDDLNSVIEFKNQTKIDYYSNEKLFESDFTLEQDYLVVGSGDEVFEYRIIELSDTVLSLMYLPRGNILEYEKILE